MARAREVTVRRARPAIRRTPDRRIVKPSRSTDPMPGQAPFGHGGSLRSRGGPSRRPSPLRNATIDSSTLLTDSLQFIAEFATNYWGGGIRLGGPPLESRLLSGRG